MHTAGIGWLYGLSWSKVFYFIFAQAKSNENMCEVKAKKTVGSALRIALRIAHRVVNGPGRFAGPAGRAGPGRRFSARHFVLRR